MLPASLTFKGLLVTLKCYTCYRTYKLPQDYLLLYLSMLYMVPTSLTFTGLLVTLVYCVIHVFPCDLETLIKFPDCRQPRYLHYDY